MTSVGVGEVVYLDLKTSRESLPDPEENRSVIFIGIKKTLLFLRFIPQVSGVFYLGLGRSGP